MPAPTSYRVTLRYASQDFVSVQHTDTAEQAEQRARRAMPGVQGQLATLESVEELDRDQARQESMANMTALFGRPGTGTGTGRPRL